MQNLLGLAPAVASQSVLPFPLGEGKLGVVDVRDVGAVGAAVLLDETGRHDGQIYTPTGPASIGMSTIAEDLGGHLGRAVRYVPLSEEAAREGFAAASRRGSRG